jgi:hypothetical protein
MGIGIVMETERGDRIAGSEMDDVSNILLRLTAQAKADGKQLRALAYIDPYGDTTLNALQQDAAMADIDDLKQLARSDVERKLLDDLRNFLKTSLSQRRVYVRLIGD